MNRFTRGRITIQLLLGDKWILQFIYNRIRCRVLTFIMPYITYLGGARFTISFSVLIFILVSQKIGLEIGLSLAISHLAVHIIKRIANRSRPYAALKEIKETKIPFESYSFPSGHTTAIFSLIITLNFYLASFNLILVLLATLVGVSRIYLGVHYPSDVLIGAIIGALSTYLVHFVIFI